MISRLYTPPQIRAHGVNQRATVELPVLIGVWCAILLHDLHSHKLMNAGFELLDQLLETVTDQTAVSAI